MPTAAHRIQSSLVKTAAANSDAVAIASKVVAIWRDIDTALSPIIGHRGVAALLNRSIHLTRDTYSWLSSVQEDLAETIDFAAVQLKLSQQTVENIVAVNGALLEKFVGLLTNLIGVSLTERLIQPIVDHHSTGDAA